MGQALKMRSVLTSLYFLCALVLLIFALNTAAQFYWLYSRFSWLDAVLHLLAGVWLACAFLRWAERRAEFESLAKNRLFLIIMVVAVVALVGVFWEIYELGTDIVFGNQNSIWKQANGLPDTLNDLFFDLFGSALAATVIVFSTRK